MKVVIDTNILVSALLSEDSVCRKVLYRAFDGDILPLISNTLFCEYEDVISRDYLFKRCPFDADKRNMFLDDFLSMCKWVDIRYLWRPNLRDEADNHVLELAMAGQASYIITRNIKDFVSAPDLKMDHISIVDPFDFLDQTEERQKWQH